MTVLQLVPSLEAGGAERTTIDIAAALSARGDRALVASEGGRLEAELAQAGGELFRMPVASKNPLTLIANARRLAGIIRREHVDIVHARSRAPAWSGFFASRATGVPFITTFHGVYGETNSLKRFYNSVMVRGVAVIANSHYTARLMADRYGTPSDRVVVIPRGTDLERFSPQTVDGVRRETLLRQWGLSGGERVVLNLARLTEWKGQRVLIQAASLPLLAEAKDLVVVLAGDAQGRDAYQASLEQLIDSRGLKGRVGIVGHCDDVPAALALADVAVIASTEPEAFGRTAIEAAAMGVPVVATALGATDETVLAPPAVPPGERTGWLVPPGDAGALANAISEALRLPPSERADLASRSRSHTRNFGTAAMQAATLALYDRLLRRRGVPDSFSKR